MSQNDAEKYNPKEIEAKWQKYWEEHPELSQPEDGGKKPKQYFLVEFPYPSGAGLHVGHVRSYTALDIMARKARMEGKNVLYPIGWDAFGLPTENYAIKNKIHPRQATEENVATFKRQLKRLGLSFDWSREINTTDPEYYKWTQWIFLQLYKKGLAYKTKMAINWCPSCKIGLANEEVIDGKCERCGTPVEQREKEQWMLKITEYADRLLKDLETVDYSDRIRIQQENWIGRSEGINISYEVEGLDEKVKVFTTRPDTNFGATFIVAAPDSEFVRENLDSFPEREKVKEYVEAAAKKTELERISEGRKKTGVFTGLYAINNLNERKMPIYVGDFVIASVGTGVVVGVPGHDSRDFEFARAMGIEIVRVVVGPDGDESEITEISQVQEAEGRMVNSDFLNGLDIHAATEKIKDYLEEKGWGERLVRYHLRDWVFSRQHYWGEPIPMIYCEECGWQPVPEEELPVELPKVEHYEPTDTGESPLSAMTEWVEVKCPECGGEARRETDTMPNWAGSSWYFLRYIDPKNDKALADKKKLEHWMPVDLYNGGMEHTTLHLLYSRFWNKFLYDIGIVPESEPYARRRSHGIVLAEDGRKMSKSYGNVVNPEIIADKFGADALRIYEMFMGPFSDQIPWSTQGLKGVYRFLEKVWELADMIEEGRNEAEQVVHKTVKKVGGDIEEMKFNTAVSQLMIAVNEVTKLGGIDKSLLEKLVLVLAPLAPHLAEEIWEKIDGEGSIFEASWPEYDEDKIKEEEVEIVVQVNGKVRDRLKMKSGSSKIEVEAEAVKREQVGKWLVGQEVKKVVFVEDKLINFVI